jgi:hypothetical protein
MSDRNADGRFAAGNKATKGNPFAPRVAQLRSVLMETVSDDDMRGVVQTLVALAKGGDVAAIKLLLDRLLGRVSTLEADDDDPREAILEEVCELRQRTPDAQRRILAGLAVTLGCRDMLTSDAAALADVDPAQLVRMDQIAAFARRSKRTVQLWQRRDRDFPRPVVEGGGGKAALWHWPDVVGYLRRKSGIASLPDRFPALKR